MVRVGGSETHHEQVKKQGRGPISRGGGESRVLHRDREGLGGRNGGTTGRGGGVRKMREGGQLRGEVKKLGGGQGRRGGVWSHGRGSD